MGVLASHRPQKTTPNNEPAILMTPAEATYRTRHEAYAEQEREIALKPYIEKLSRIATNSIEARKRERKASDRTHELLAKIKVADRPHRKATKTPPTDLDSAEFKRILRELDDLIPPPPPGKKRGRPRK